MALQSASVNELQHVRETFGVYFKVEDPPLPTRREPFVLTRLRLKILVSLGVFDIGLVVGLLAGFLVAFVGRWVLH